MPKNAFLLSNVDLFFSHIVVLTPMWKCALPFAWVYMYWYVMCVCVWRFRSSVFKIFTRFQRLSSGWCQHFLVLQHYVTLHLPSPKQERRLFNRATFLKLCLCTGVASSGNIQTLDWRRDGVTGRVSTSCGKTLCKCMISHIRSCHFTQLFQNLCEIVSIILMHMPAILQDPLFLPSNTGRTSSSFPGFWSGWFSRTSPQRSSSYNKEQAPLGRSNKNIDKLI